MSRLRHEKGLPRMAGAGSGLHRLEAGKPLPFKQAEERKCGGKIAGRKEHNRLGRKRGGHVSHGHHGTDATPDRGMKFGTPVQDSKMDGPGHVEDSLKDGGKIKWIQHAVNPKHKGIEQRAAKKAGVSTHEYLEKHKHDSGKEGARARLGLRLSAMSKKK